jgi:hypothetical protein
MMHLQSPSYGKERGVFSIRRSIRARSTRLAASVRDQAIFNRDNPRP